ncbi:hypothetical protein [Novosphingobium sp.]|uniref:hypothetical protein n=1 Tax=Novosphingobium sp. TaxID=1874826 RepID=UPI003341796E
MRAHAQAVTMLPVVVQNCMRNAAMPGVTVGAKNGGSGISEIHGHASIPLPRGMKAGDPVSLEVYDPTDVVLLFPLRGEGEHIPSGAGNYVEMHVIRTRDLTMLQNAACLAGVMALASHRATAPHHSRSTSPTFFQLAAFSPDEQNQAAPLGLINSAAADRVGFSVAQIEAAMAAFSSDPLTWKSVLLTAQIDFGNHDPFSTILSFGKTDVEFGIGWWGLRRGTLQTLLQQMRNADRAQFDAAMGDGLPFIEKLIAASGTDAIDMANRELVDSGSSSRIKALWNERFGQLGSNPTFQHIQFQNLQPWVDKARAVTAQYGLRSERGFAFVYDVLYSRGRVAEYARVKAAFGGFREKFGRDPDEAEKLLLLANLVKSRLGVHRRDELISRAYAFATGHGIVFGRGVDLDSDGLGMRDMRTGKPIVIREDKSITEKLLQGWLPDGVFGSPTDARPSTTLPPSTPQPST